MFLDNNQSAFNNDSQLKHIISSDFMLLASDNEAVVNIKKRKEIQTSVSQKGNMPQTKEIKFLKIIFQTSLKRLNKLPNNTFVFSNIKAQHTFPYILITNDNKNKYNIACMKVSTQTAQLMITMCRHSNQRYQHKCSCKRQMSKWLS